MSFHHRFLAAAYHPVRVARTIGRSLGLVSPNQLRVLLYHDIPPAEEQNFSAQMRWLKQSWNFVSLKQFEDMVSGEIPVRGRNLLLTFDDGFASNRVVTDKILNPMGIKALFFVVSKLVGMDDRLEARQLIASSVCPGTRAEDLPPHWNSMGWGDLEALLEHGHGIGCHTASHARLSEIECDAELEREIVASAEDLEKRLHTAISHFSYTFGDLASFSQAGLAIARRRFRFIHSGLRGDNVSGVSPYSLRRDSAARQDSRSNYTIFSNMLLGTILEGVADARYANSLAELDDWIARE